MKQKIIKLVCFVFGHKNPGSNESRFICSRCDLDIITIR